MIAPHPEALANHPVIRRMHAEDAPKVAEIVREAETAADWSIESYQDAAAAPDFIALVSDENGVITGFILGRHVDREAEILNLAVSPPFRKRGHAAALLSGVLQELRKLSGTCVFLEVRESNRPAIEFYRKYGFRESGRRPNYYRNPGEDALCMVKNLTD